jgi:hypothetical protein
MFRPSPGEDPPVPSRPVQRFVVRVWLPDRPGALGQVASRIGSVGADVEGIEILERGAGRAIDELVVSLGDPARLPLLVAEIGEVDGVDVEEVRALSGEHPDAVIAMLDLAARLAESGGEAVLGVLCRDLRVHLELDWAVALRLEPAAVLAGEGDNPSPAWIAAFVGGAAHLPAGADNAPADLAWSGLPRHAAALVVGRRGRPFRGRERAQVASLARLADALAPVGATTA